MAISTPPQDATKNTFGDLNLSITGIGREYPPFNLVPEDLDIICKRHYELTPAIKKILLINQYTGIDSRSAVGGTDHIVATSATAPSIDLLSKIFLADGVPLAVTAARKALHEAQLSPTDITHVVSTTCTNSANPGFDHFVCKALGMTQTVEKVLLHGVGCSGGLAALRTAANLALGSTFRGRKARILVVALEISSTMVRSELDSAIETGETRIGITLFSDCASALVLSNGIDERVEPVYELLGWDHRMIPDSEVDLGFDVDPKGWKVVLSPRVPKLAAAAVSPAFDTLMSTLPNLPSAYQSAVDFDWALHPGGATILSGVERAMSITPEHMRASYDTYINHGNSSSATIFSVMDRMRDKDMDELAPDGRVKDFVVACAFGPGIAVEMALLKRNLRHVKRTLVGGGDMTPPETEASDGSRSDGSRSDSEGDEEGAKQLNDKLNVAQTEEVGDSLSEALNGVDLD